MADGIKIYNDSGTIQIDETWRNMAYQGKFTLNVSTAVTSPPNPAAYNGQPYDLTFSGSEAALVICKASVVAPVKMQQYYASGTWYITWLFLSTNGGSQAETVTFYIFDTLNGSYGSVGVRVMKPTGEVIFHSDSRPMKWLGLQGGTSSFTASGGQTIAPLILVNNLNGQNFGSGYRIYASALRSSGSTITPFTTGPVGGSFIGFGNPNWPGLYAAIDITGL